MAADAAVRGGRPADAAAIGAVHSRAWRTSYATTLPPQVSDALEPEALTAAWLPALASPPSSRHRVLVATAGELVVGFAAVAPSADPDTGPDDGELTALEVDPAHRGAGHGSRLLNAAVDTLSESAAPRLLVWVPAADRPRAAFLEASGLVDDGGRRSGADEDGARWDEVRLSAMLVKPDASP